MHLPVENAMSVTCSKAGHSTAASKPRTSARDMRLEMLWLLLRVLGSILGNYRDPKHRNIWKGGRKTTSMFHVCPGKSSVPRLLMYWGSAELENWQGREVRKPWQEKVKSVLQDMSGTAKLRSKGEKPGVSSIKQGPRMEEFNYNTNYTLCKEFWDVEDSTAKRRAV